MKTSVTLLIVCSFGLSCFAVCPSMDFTGDCCVDLADFIVFVEQWLTEGDPDPAMDFTGDCRVDLADFTMFVEQWLTEGVPEHDIVWVSINDPGVSGHEGFNGEMSKYETTNAQFAQYLNAAKASDDITIFGIYVRGASGSNAGQDFVGQYYYNLAGEGFDYNGATNGGVARINWTGSSFTVDSGFENHPVTHVSWYGATAFACYYGWRLPTEWEWQAVADYNGTYKYGCGTTITNSIANYTNSIHPHGTTPVGQFGMYGYGMADMAGNVWEWTSSLWTTGDFNRIIRGGTWGGGDHSCTVSNRFGYSPIIMGYYYGFRVCR